MWSVMGDKYCTCTYTISPTNTQATPLNAQSSYQDDWGVEGSLGYVMDAKSLSKSSSAKIQTGVIHLRGDFIASSTNSKQCVASFLVHQVLHTSAYRHMVLLRSYTISLHEQVFNYTCCLLITVFSSPLPPPPPPPPKQLTVSLHHGLDTA